jgi:glutathione S-transferase
MRLYTSPASPFVRKCRVVLREKGLIGGCEEVEVTFPYKDGAYTQINPLGQIPALETDEGPVLFNSPVICAYLDDLGGEPRLLPPERTEHWRVRRLETLADGAMEMTVKQVLESRRPEALRSADWVSHWRGGLERALDQAEAEAPDPSETHLGSIALAIACTYAEFRLVDFRYGEGRPRLRALTETLEQRPSFRETYPR